jgi:8-oxo-dGTP pyrophosphatase MutT (NUDIX family)
MSVLERVNRLYREGHAKAPPAMWLDPRIHEIAEFKPASVLVAITDRPEPGMLLIHRPDTMRAHPGQIAFPGGRRDPGEDAITAALREAEEELGIDPALVRVVGPSDLYRSGSGYEITPVIAVVPGDIAITPNPTEVASWFEAPVAFVLNPENQTVQEIEAEGARHRFVEIVWQEHVIWGVTGAILSNLAKRLEWGAP